MQIPTTVVAIPDSGDAVATLNGQMYPSKLLRVAITGVIGSTALVFLGGARVDQTSRGSSNTNEFTHPVEIPAGTPVSIRWPGQGAKAVQCSATFTVER